MRNSNSNTNGSMPAQPHLSRRSRKFATACALTGAAALAFGPVHRAAACWYDPIIFDPQSLVEHVLQVAQTVQQVESAVEQVKNQVLGLAHLGASVAPNVPKIVAGIQGQFDANLYGSSDPAGQLDNRFPADMSGATWDQFQSDETTWTADERQSLAENRRLQNQVYRDMDQTRQQVQTIVNASNAAPGETAAIQAHDDLMAVASAEFTKLQALKAARSRLRTEKLARQQSELSYAAAERSRVRDGWDSPVVPSVNVTDPFQQ